MGAGEEEGLQSAKSLAHYQEWLRHLDKQRIIEALLVWKRAAGKVPLKHDSKPLGGIVIIRMISKVLWVSTKGKRSCSSCLGLLTFRSVSSSCDCQRKEYPPQEHTVSLHDTQNQCISKNRNITYYLCDIFFHSHGDGQVQRDLQNFVLFMQLLMDMRFELDHSLTQK